MIRLATILASCALCLTSCHLETDKSQRKAVQYPPEGRPVIAKGSTGRMRVVAANLNSPPAVIAEDSQIAPAGMVLAEPPKRKTKRKGPRYRKIEDWRPQDRGARKGIGTQLFEGPDFDTNGNVTGGFFFSPSDPTIAAGPNHLVVSVNSTIEIYTKTGIQVSSESLADFFTDVNPLTFTFDPKVLYDQYEDRFVVLTLEQTDIDNGDPANTSRIFIAVSDTNDPTGTWSVVEIDSAETFDSDPGVGTEDHWADFPGLAIDEEAVYVTVNLFQFFDQSGPGEFGGSRVYIVDKGVNNGFYDGRTADVDRYNPFSSNPGPGDQRFPGTHQPAHIFGTPPSGNIGTWLVLQSGLNNGPQESVQIVRINNPLGSPPTFTFIFEDIGNIDDLAGDIGNLPQDDTAVDVDGGDRRTLSAVWRDDSLYFTATANARGDNDETTAYWAEISTQNNQLQQLGLLDGEDIANTTFTAYAAVAVNDSDVVALGFTSANNSGFLSSHYALHFPGDGNGSNRGSTLLRLGEDEYERAFGRPEHRWGDYSDVALDPNGACFWIFNKYAATAGTAIDGEDGRWGTVIAEVCENQRPAAVADALTVAEGGTVSETDGSDSSLLDNDSDGDGDNLTMTTTAVTQPGVGLLTQFDASGEFTYEHDGSDSTNDLFRYEVCDDGDPVLCAEAQVNVTITEVNDPPEAADDTGPAIAEDEQEDVPFMDLLSNDNVGDVGTGQTLDVIGVQNEVGGTATVLSNRVRFVPDDDFFGAASFEYTVEDDGTSDGSNDPQTDSATVSINVTEVNDEPVAGDDTPVDSPEDVPYVISFASLLTNDSAGPANESDQTLSINLLLNEVGGDAVISGDTVVFTPDPEFAGPARFDYRVVDDGTTNGSPAPLTDVGRATFGITSVNDPPIANDDTGPDTPENTPEVIISVASVLANDSPGPGNEGGQTLTLVSVGDAVGGSVLIHGTEIRFSITPQFNGVASFSYTVTDDGQTAGAPDPQTAEGQVTFNVIGVNDPPTASADAISVEPGRRGIVLDSGETRLTANDTDPESGVLTVETMPVVAPSAGTVTLNPDGSFEYIRTGSALTDTFRYRVCDDGTPSACAEADVTVTVVSPPFARCTPSGSRSVVGILSAFPGADLFDDPRGQFAAQGLPASFSIDPDNGIITGTPVAGDVVNSPYFVTVTSSGAPRNFWLQVDATTDAAFFSSFENQCL
ncbi:MAG: Ig-like domain-containing protein [Pseudomonadota bacterium]